MLKATTLSLLFFSFVAYSYPDVGSARYTTDAKVYHKGDYVDYTYEFKASCYETSDTPYENVATNVRTFIDWLQNEVTSANAAYYDYEIGLINRWQREYSNDDDPCYRRYYASQKVTVTMSKLEGANYLEWDLIKYFFTESQQAIRPLNSESTNGYAYTTAKVTSVRKGVYEETKEQLIIKAKEMAQQKATNYLLAALGNDYKGYYYLYKIDFSNQQYGGGLHYEALPASKTLPGGQDKTVSMLKLKPYSLETEGTFTFYYKLIKNQLP